jgi:hypothetical protein
MALRALSAAAATQVTKKKGGILGGATLEMGSDDATLLIFDSDAVTTDTTKIIGRIKADVTLQGATTTHDLTLTEPVKYTNGLYVAITGTAAAFTIYYK